MYTAGKSLSYIVRRDQYPSLCVQSLPPGRGTHDGTEPRQRSGAIAEPAACPGTDRDERVSAEERTGKQLTRELPKAYRKTVEELWDSACATLAAVDVGVFSEGEEEEGKEEGEEVLVDRSHVASFLNVRAHPECTRNPLWKSQGCQKRQAEH